jgi:hypothetical protein
MKGALRGEAEQPPTETHPAAQTNARIEGAQSGSRTPRPRPGRRRAAAAEDRDDQEMSPVPSAFASDPAASAQPTERHHGPEDRNDDDHPARGKDDAARHDTRAADESRDFGRPREVPPPAAGAPVTRVPVEDDRDRGGGGGGGGIAVPEPSIGAADVALGKPSAGDATGDTAPREDGGQAANPPKSLGSAGGGSSGPGSAYHNE